MIPTFLPKGRVGKNYPTQTFSPSSGSLVLFDGTIPSGFTLTIIDNTNWTFSGIPTHAGTYTFTIQGSGESQQYTLIVQPRKRKRRGAAPFITFDCKGDCSIINFRGAIYRQLNGNIYTSLQN